MYLLQSDQFTYINHRLKYNPIITSNIPIQDYFNVTLSKNDPEMFYYEKNEPEDFTQKENEDNKAEAWTTVPGKFDIEDNQSPTKSIKPLPETSNTFQPLLVEGQDDDEENADVKNLDSPSPTSSDMLSYSNSNPSNEETSP